MKRMIFLCLMCFPVFSQAAIYKCVDDRGVASFSQRPCPAKKVVGNTEAHKLHKELGELTDTGQNLVTSISGDMKSIIACQDSKKVFEKNRKALQSRVDGLTDEHKALKKAYATLEFCGVCKARGLSQCRTTRSYLNEAQNTLITSVDQANPKGWAHR
ncbi:MAG: DUF4124 domain-containing protein [Cellvibrionaceae bacterium]